MFWLKQRKKCTRAERNRQVLLCKCVRLWVCNVLCLAGLEKIVMASRLWRERRGPFLRQDTPCLPRTHQVNRELRRRRRRRRRCRVELTKQTLMEMQFCWSLCSKRSARAYAVAAETTETKTKRDALVVVRWDDGWVGVAWVSRSSAGQP